MPLWQTKRNNEPWTSLQNREKTRKAIFEYAEVDYNRQHQHGVTGFISLDRPEAKFVI